MVGFAWLPPETNSLRMYLGAGSRPLLAAAGAWDGLAEELHAAASSFGSVTSELAGGAWQGPASAAMARGAVCELVDRGWSPGRAGSAAGSGGGGCI